MLNDFECMQPFCLLSLQIRMLTFSADTFDLENNQVCVIFFQTNGSYVLPLLLPLCDADLGLLQTVPLLTFLWRRKQTYSDFLFDPYLRCYLPGPGASPSVISLIGSTFLILVAVNQSPWSKTLIAFKLKDFNIYVSWSVLNDHSTKVLWAWHITWIHVHFDTDDLFYYNGSITVSDAHVFYNNWRSKITFHRSRWHTNFAPFALRPPLLPNQRAYLAFCRPFF